MISKPHKKTVGMFTQEPKQNSNASATATVLGFRNCQAKSKIKSLSKRFQYFIVYKGFTVILLSLKNRNGTLL